MSIIISLGNVGSGKTAVAVREMEKDGRKVKTYSNIITKGIDHNNVIDARMIVKKEIKEIKTKRDGTKEPIYDWKINDKFWRSLPKPINVVIDEAHSVMNARKSMSKANIIVTDWLALLRRVLGSVDAASGSLTLITQLPNRIDVIAREMATMVKFHRCHFTKTCKACGLSWGETNDNPEPSAQCYRCGSYELMKHNHRIEVFHFANMENYQTYSMFNIATYHRHYFINDIETIFPLYDTLQWDNLFENIY